MGEKVQPSRVARALGRAADFARTVPPLTQWVGGATLAAWLLKATVLDYIVEPFWPLYAVGQVVNGVLSALISGYVFYILFALWPEYESRSVMLPFILGKTGNIIGGCQAVLFDVKRHSGVDLTLAHVDAAQIEPAFASVKTSVEPALRIADGRISRVATWSEFFMFHQARTKEAISELLDQSKYLDASMIVILTEISNNEFFGFSKSVSDFALLTAPQPDLTQYGKVFPSYMASCRKLAEWHDKHSPCRTDKLLASR